MAARAFIAAFGGLCSVACLPGGSASALAQAAAPPAQEEAFSEFNGRLVAQVRFEGLRRVSEQFAVNQLRTLESQPFQAETANADVRRLYRLGEFRTVEVRVQPLDDVRVAVVYQVEEAPLIADVVAVDNEQINDDELIQALAGSGLVRGAPIDEFLLGRAQRTIEALYRSKGFYLAGVEIDREELEEGVIVFRIREGQRVRVTAVRFDGNDRFSSKRLRREVKTKVAGVFKKGVLDEDQIAADIAALISFHRDRGYLDARADRRTTFSPDGREVIVTFLIDEGPLYTFRDVVLRPATEGEQLIFDSRRVIGLIGLKPGDVYGAQSAQLAGAALREAYWKLGHADVRVGVREMRAVDEPRVDLLLDVFEGRRWRTGEVIVQGNTVTKQSVALREVEALPDRPLDPGAIENTRRRLNATGLFDQLASPPKITILPEDPDYPDHRDVLIEVKETNTGAFSFGAAVSSDAGVLGSVSLTQRNFDIADVPDSIDELLAGRAFRGGGQTFDLTAAPGTDLQNYSISLRDPRLFETDYSGSVSAFFNNRIFDDYDEERIGGRLGFGRRFGDRWSASLNFRLEQVSLSDIDSNAPVDLFEVADTNVLIGAGVRISRNTVPPAERIRPGRGSVSSVNAEQIFGDFNFTKLGFAHEQFFAVYDNGFGQTSVVSFKTNVQYIPQEDEAPVYERFFLGGRTFRGFDFRGISPRGVRNDLGVVGDDPVGGQWSIFLGAEFDQPLYGEDPRSGAPVVSGVLFLDTGTVTNDPGFDDYRVSAGFGLRLRVPGLGQVPLAFDFGFPVVSQADDDEQLFSFNVDLPF